MVTFYLPPSLLSSIRIPKQIEKTECHPAAARVCVEFQQMREHVVQPVSEADQHNLHIQPFNILMPLFTLLLHQRNNKKQYKGT
ncbi:hypothetical protein M8C21_008253 [Ambrosia artemisiifolia]|uniref:Uncharacterized protein n=1 Tax=Ambrosia artemisiifolia TaxID=4212 RepID=A0AAD5DA97_AMBAR|nr:hypothetical protein M8C21_008253 [Ambrosia artemisiifolia]